MRRANPPHEIDAICAVTWVYPPLFSLTSGVTALRMDDHSNVITDEVDDDLVDQEPDGLLRLDSRAGVSMLVPIHSKGQQWLAIDGYHRVGSPVCCKRRSAPSVTGSAEETRKQRFATLGSSRAFTQDCRRQRLGDLSRRLPELIRYLVGELRDRHAWWRCRKDGKSNRIKRLLIQLFVTTRTCDL